MINLPDMEYIIKNLNAKRGDFSSARNDWSFFEFKKSILAKTLSIGFSQVAQSTEARKLLEKSEDIADNHIQSLSKTLRDDNLHVPMSCESEITTSKDAPSSDE